MSNQYELAMKLKAHAEKHYDEGWDTFVECYEDSEYVEFVGDMTTWAEVLAMAEDINSVTNDRRADARYEIEMGG